MDPEAIAKASNFVTYPNANAKSWPLIDEAVKSDPNLFPPEELREKLFVITPFDQRSQRNLTRIWTRVVKGG
jgi:putrescine transport system substrate-binding protein